MIFFFFTGIPNGLFRIAHNAKLLRKKQLKIPSKLISDESLITAKRPNAVATAAVAVLTTYSMYSRRGGGLFPRWCRHGPPSPPHTNHGPGIRPSRQQPPGALDHPSPPSSGL